MKFIPLELPKTIYNGKEYDVVVYDHVLLKKRRQELGLTLQQVADRAGILLRQYQRVESGERHITSASCRIMLAICSVLMIDPYEFFPEFKNDKDE